MRVSAANMGRARAIQVLALVVPLVVAAPAAAAVRVESPAAGGLVLGSAAVVSVRTCRGGELKERVRLDGVEVRVAWSRGPYARQWYGEVALAGEGRHRLEVAGRCGRRRSETVVEFTSRTGGTLASGVALARAYMREHPAAKLRWDWGPAVLLYALATLAETRPGPVGDEARAYVREFHERWAGRRRPAIDRSDRAAPALSAVSLVRLEGSAAALANARAGIDYVQSAPRNRLGTIDHLGHSWLRVFYPHSIWVDSLMMYAVLAARWGRRVDDRALLAFAAAQPVRFAAALQDPRDGLFRHAWRVEANTAIPVEATYWLRGNGWVLVAIVEIVEELTADDPRRAELLRIFGRLAAALRQWQQPDGLWDSLINAPGQTFAETSGSALVAYALARAVHRGWIDGSYLEVARRAFAGVTARLERRGGELSLPSISGPTNPGPRWLYRAVRARRDLPYGVGPYLLAALELDGEKFP